MVDPWKIPATGWMVVVAGWCFSPVISFYLQKLFAYLIFDPPKELRELEFHTVPALKETLRNVEEQRMVRAARDLESRSDLKTLDEMDVELKYALYQAEDILDLFDYHRIEKKISGDRGSWGVQQLIHAAGSSIFARCCRASWARLQRLIHDGGACVACWTGILTQRCKDITPAPPLQLVQSMKQQLGRFFVRISLWSSGAILPTSQATSTVGVSGWCSQHVTSITSYLLSWCTDRITGARSYRDWSYEQVGIKSDQQEDYNVPIKDKIRVRNQIKVIEDILTSSKKSDLLNNKNSSNGTTKDNDKGSSSCCRTTTKVDDKESSSNCRAKESSSTQKEIDDMYRNIEHEVFGREEDREHISRMLRKGPDTYAASSSTSKPYSVIGIYGITGYGKTTLAQYVCDYEKSVEHFNPIMFIHVGKTFSLGDILCDMLGKITESRASNDKDLKSLKTELWENLKGKRFLLVLDDLWVNDGNQKEREILLHTLNAALSGSRILVTAQKKDAAEALGAQEQISIPELEEEVYLSLFMYHARPDVSDDDGKYRSIGSKIAKRLCRSPIAAVTVGKQLQRNKSISFWQATASLDVLNKTMGALWWSYQQLGDDIRRCFAYCSTFPKGYGLKRDELVRIWIAQGFVNTRDNATEELEDIGQIYFDQLLTLSFLQGQRAFFDDEPEEFAIHDLLHELAEKVSGSEFFRIRVNGSPEDIPRRVHHLLIETKNVAEISEKILDLGNLRTLIINEDSFDSGSMFTKVERNHDLERLLERLFMRLKELRVLIIKVNLPTNEFSVAASIDHIKHLRYLAFPFPHGLYHLILPSTFSKLYHLQTIDIPCKLASCPEDMANLVHLRHTSAPLYFPNIGWLTSLQTLERFMVKEEQGYELNQLKHLKKLRGNLSIEGLGYDKRKEEALEANLAQKEGLRKLELVFGWWANGDPDVEAEVLEGLCPPMHLEELSIWYYNGSGYPSWMLSRHYSETAPKHLQKLELSGCSQLASIPEDSELFIGLCELIIYDCDWDRLPQNMERLVSLQTLNIWDCKKMKLLGTLPHQSLEQISIDYSGVLSKTCKEEGHENWRKIRHIPKKYIR